MAEPTTPVPLDLDAIGRRIPPSYDGPWYVELDERSGNWLVGYPTDNPLAGLVATVPDYGERLAQFIAHAREDVPALLAEVQRLRAELRTARRCLAEHADCDEPDCRAEIAAVLGGDVQPQPPTCDVVLDPPSVRLPADIEQAERMAEWVDPEFREFWRHRAAKLRAALDRIVRPEPTDAVTALRDRLAQALGTVGRCEHPGAESCGPWWLADAAVPAVAAWLTDLAAVQWERAERHPDARSREMALVKAMWATDRALELGGATPGESSAASSVDGGAA